MFINPPRRRKEKLQTLKEMNNHIAQLETKCRIINYALLYEILTLPTSLVGIVNDYYTTPNRKKDLLFDSVCSTLISLHVVTIDIIVDYAYENFERISESIFGKTVRLPYSSYGDLRTPVYLKITLPGITTNDVR